MTEKEFKEFIVSNEPEYANGVLRLVFNKNSNKGSFLSAFHYGWKCPSMYNDSREERGCCDIKDIYWTEEKGWEKGLFLAFTEDNYSEREYLVLQVLNLDTLIVKKDRHGRAGLVLDRVMQS